MYLPALLLVPGLTWFSLKNPAAYISLCPRHGGTGAMESAWASETYHNVRASFPPWAWFSSSVKWRGWSQWSLLSFASSGTPCGQGSLRNRPTHDPGVQDTAVLRARGDHSKHNQQVNKDSQHCVGYMGSHHHHKKPFLQNRKAVISISIAQMRKLRLREAEQIAHK